MSARNKPGKKIDVLRIEEGAQRHNVELRFDKSRGTFHAHLGGVDFSAPTLKEITDKLQERARTLVEYEYKWYIRVDYGIDESCPGASWSGGTSFDELEEGRIIVGINFRFRVEERSQAVKTDDTDYRGNPVWMRLHRSVEENDAGELEPVGPREPDKFSPNTDGDDDDGWILFTPERYAKLKAIQAALYELARRLHEVVGKDAKAVQRALDALPTQPKLLAAPEKKAARS